MGDALASLGHLRREWKTRYRDDSFRVPSATLNFGCVHGGDSPNRICAACRLQFDVRLMPGMRIDAVREELDAILAPVARRHGVDFSLRSLFAGVPPLSGRADDPFVAWCERVSGRTAETVAFTTEGPFFHAAGLHTVVLGPGDIEVAHQPDEYLPLDRIQPTLTLLGRLIGDICIDALPTEASP